MNIEITNTDYTNSLFRQHREELERRSVRVLYVAYLLDEARASGSGFIDLKTFGTDLLDWVSEYPEDFENGLHDGREFVKRCEELSRLRNGAARGSKKARQQAEEEISHTSWEFPRSAYEKYLKDNA